jgi:AmmeMemoRadiSam system protein B
MQDARPSPISGTWYPGSPDALVASVDSQLKAAQISPQQGEVIGIIAPHAGHRYSGGVAAHAFLCLQGLEPEIVAVLSPLHQPYRGRLYTTGHLSYATPLGEIPVEHSLVDRLDEALQTKSGLTIERIRDDQEHSLEIELPFLQRVIETPFRLLPLMLRDQSRETCEALGNALADVMAKEKHVLVASSDLSHFKSDALARQLDAVMLERIEAFDPAGVLETEEQNLGFACGRGAIAAALWAAEGLGADRVEILNYGTSGDVTGDQTAVVGYAAAVITRQSEASP